MHALLSGAKMDNPYMLYFIVTLAMVLFFGFCIGTTWFFAKMVLGIMPQGKTNDGDKKEEENQVQDRGNG